MPVSTAPLTVDLCGNGGAGALIVARHRKRSQGTLLRFFVLHPDEVWSHWTPRRARGSVPRNRSHNASYEAMPHKGRLGRREAVEISEKWCIVPEILASRDWEKEKDLGLVALSPLPASAEERT